MPPGEQIMAIGGRLRERLRRLGAGGAAPAIVFECSYVNGLSAIRSLARLGVPVIAVDHRHQALGLRSRLALGLVGPPPGHPDTFAAFLHELCDALAAESVAFPTHDDYLVAVSAAAPASLRLPFGPPELIVAVQSKRFQYEAADRAGVPLPVMFHPDSLESARRAAAAIPYPAVMKPALGSGFKAQHGRPLIEAACPEQLLAAYAVGEPYLPMFQELIPGGDDSLWTVGSYLSASGEPVGVFCGRKLLQAPAGVGTCRVGEATWDQEAVDGALRLLRELGFHGISQVEYKRDARDGSLRLMEVNARLWQWHSLAADCGVDLVAMAYRDVLGLPVTPATSERAGRRRWVALVRHLRESRRDRIGLRRTLAPLRPPFSEPVLSLRDPMPGVHQIYAALRSGAR
jgi:D-aspartate ligase